MVEIVLRRAEQMNVPVMFSGVGVEGFDDCNKICMQLKASLNRECVKVITVRDDIKTLRTFYLNTDSSIKTVKVSDAACSLNALYPSIQRKRGTIGLGVIRGDIFAEYGNRFSENDLFNLYVNLYFEIVKNDKKCCIFTNGTPGDQRFADRLSRYLNVERTAPVSLCPRPKTVAELVNNITKCEAVVAARLHAGVIAFSYGIPFVELVWNQKQRFFWREHWVTGQIF